MDLIKGRFIKIRGGKGCKLLLSLIILCIICVGTVVYVYFRPIGDNLAGVKVCFYGDSITEIGHWEKVIDMRAGFDSLYLCGIGSTSYTSSDLWIFLDADNNYCGRSNVNEQPEGTDVVNGSLSSIDRIERTIPADTDIIFIMAGTNDWELDVSEDRFKSAVEATVDGVRTYLGEDTIIVLITPLSGRKSGNKGEALNEIGLATSDYARYVMDVANEMNLYYIDIFNETLIRQWNRDLFIRDSVHPNYLGELEIERVVGEWINKCNLDHR